MERTGGTHLIPRGSQYPKKKNKLAGISDKFIRLLKIYTIIAQKRYPSAKSLAENLGVNARTIYRDLFVINLVDQVDYDQERKGYAFTHGDSIKKPLLSDEELMTLFTAGEAVSHLGAPFRENFQRLVEKMVSATAKPPSKGKPPIVIKVPDTARSGIIDSSLKIIATCLQDRRSVDITYKAHGTKEVTKRTIDPYGLIFYEGIWILIGFCHLRKEIRSFALDRIQDCGERNLYFSPRSDFNLEEYLAKSWGVVDGEEMKVVVRFKPEVAEYITRKDKWHPSEARKMLPDGGVELAFTVAGIYEIKKWIYSWIPHIEVVKPRSLRDLIKKELIQATQDHK
jgi:predicted DNA-binding transcriptional regulator YafY